MLKKHCQMLLLLVLLAQPALAADTPPVDEIVRLANHMALYQGQDGKGRVSIAITDKQGRSRSRSFTMLRRDVGQNDQDQQYFVYFNAPGDIRGMTFLVHKHAGPGKDDDRWLYLPSLDLVKRIAASDKRTSFVGSDFLYEDISGRSPSEDSHVLIAATDQTYVIKNTPRNPATVEFAYYVAHIDRQTFIPMKIEYFKADRRCYRRIEVLEVARVAVAEKGVTTAYPTVVRSRASNLESGGSSEMRFGDIRYNLGLTESLFSERYLRRPPRDVLR
jgi:hypothetical protein